MLILGIDPGTATTGYGVLRVNKVPGKEEKPNGHFDTVDFGLIETHKNDSPADRLFQIHDKLDRITSMYNPDIMVIEKVFFATNAKTAIRVGQAQGVMLMCASRHSLEVFEYSPMTIKKQVAGHGRAPKEDVQKSIQDILGAHIKSQPKKKTHFDNAVDALAVALCHVYVTRDEEDIKNVMKKKVKKKEVRKTKRKKRK